MHYDKIQRTDYEASYRQHFCSQYLNDLPEIYKHCRKLNAYTFMLITRKSKASLQDKLGNVSYNTCNKTLFNEVLEFCYLLINSKPSFTFEERLISFTCVIYICNMSLNGYLYYGCLQLCVYLICIIFNGRLMNDIVLVYSCACILKYAYGNTIIIRSRAIASQQTQASA